MIEIDDITYQIAGVFHGANGELVLHLKPVRQPVQQANARTTGYAIAEVTHGR